MADTFTVKLDDDKEIELEIKNPTLKDQQSAQEVYNEAFHKAIKSKTFFRGKLDPFV